MRKKIVAGNWKMNLTANEVEQFIIEINQYQIQNTEVILFAPSVYLTGLKKKLNTNIKIGAQDCSKHNKGAYTGEISAEILSSIQTDYCLVGHSERRKYHHETNDLLAEKINRLLENNIKAIYCCGEDLQQRESDEHFSLIKKQIEEGLFHLNQEQFKNIVIAYEPVWAIGTGKTASPEQAQEIHDYIRKVISAKYSQEIAENTSILYGGSCNSENAPTLFACADIDGGLIGGASLKVESFMKITESF